MVNDQFRSILESVILCWQQSTKAYQDYMEKGKKFRYAEILMLHNTSARQLLVDNFAVIPDRFKEDARAIIEHYIIWSSKWDELKNKLHPAPGDEFVFENDHRFPKAAAKNLEAALSDLT